MRTRLCLASILLVVYALPIILLITGAVPFRLRFEALIGMSIVALLLARAAHFSAYDLGFRTDNFRAALWCNVGFVVLCLSSLALARALGQVRVLSRIPDWGFFVFYVLLSCPSQEFLFRSFLWAQLTALGKTSIWLRVAILALPYACAHLIYRDTLTFLAAFFVGLCWSLIYERYPNWYAITISHCCLGVASIATGLI